MMSARYGKEAILEILILAGADVNQENNVSVFSRCTNVTIARFKSFMFYFDCSKDGWTPLMHCSALWTLKHCEAFAGKRS